MLIHLKTLPRITYHHITYTFPQEVRVGGAQQEAARVARAMGMSAFSGWLKKAQRDDKEGVEIPENYPEIKTMVIIKNENYPELIPHIINIHRGKLPLIISYRQCFGAVRYYGN